MDAQLNTQTTPVQPEAQVPPTPVPAAPPQPAVQAPPAAAPVAPPQPEAQVPPATPQQPVPPVGTGPQYANFGVRLVAFLIDTVIIVIVGFIAGGIFGGVNYSDGTVQFGAIPTLFMWAYSVIMVAVFGATLGKTELVTSIFT